MQKRTLWALMVITYIIGVIGISFILFESVTTKLERSCNEFDMNYVFRGGTNCLDKNNVMHPIEAKCPIMRWDRLCEIRFIQSQT